MCKNTDRPVQKTDKMDFRLDSPATFLLTGPSSCGKTTILENLLEYAPEIFKDHSFLQYIVFFYKVKTCNMERIKRKLSKIPMVKKIEFINQCPTGQLLHEKTEPWKYTGGSTVVIDDWGAEIPKCVASYFTVLSHHHNSTGFMLTQNLFPNEEHHRIISRNCNHILVFQNFRDKAQFRCFAKQFDPNGKYLTKVYNHILENEPYTYIWFDLCQKTHPQLRVKSNFTPPEWPIHLYLKADNYGD